MNEKELSRTYKIKNNSSSWNAAVSLRHYVIKGVKVSIYLLLIVYIVIPVIVKTNQWILPKLVFCTFVSWPPFINLSQPSDFGLNHTKNFYLQTDQEISTGAWQILPKSLENKDISLEDYEKHLSDGSTVFLYLHGNSGTRGSYHRIQLYRLLSSLNFHVLTLDYRGYGDSTGTTTEDGVVQDAYYTYKWLRQRVKKSNVFIWGHSLGTGVTSKLGKILSEEGDSPCGIVLEAPFNNINDAAFYHPLAAPFRMLPWFHWVFIEGLGKQGIHFRSDNNILSITAPIMILHAKDDFIVPYHLGEKLYTSATTSRKHHTSTQVDFISFEANKGFGHKRIYKAPNLSDIIRKFVARSC